MKTFINKLVEIGSEPFVTNKPNQNEFLKDCPDLLKLLEDKNGFFVFESALRVFPSESCVMSYSLTEWNSDKLWKNHYGNLAKEYFFFAEDIYGGQFCYSGSKIYYFEAEMAEIDFFANSLDEWASKILQDYKTFTGFDIAHEWQINHGSLAPRNRLLPKRFFVLGGELSINNLLDVEASYGMKVRGPVAQQIHSLPDGAQIDIKVTDWEPISE